MDFRFTRDEEQFRQEIKDYLDQSMSPDLKAEIEASGGPSQAGDTGPLMREFVEQLSRDGMLTMGWPEEYGGKGLTGLKGYVASEEFARAGIGRPNNTSVSLVGPTIMRVGTEEQKLEWLPKMASGEVQCSLGYTEPGAGTDLAGLQTRAVQDGDEWVISGQKIYNGGAHENTHNWLLARTDPDAPKHRGLSVFLVPLRTPGITLRPLYTMADGRTNETFMDEVRIPLKNMIGEKNRGWYHVAMALDFERVSIGATYIRLKGQFDRLIEYVKKTPYGGSTVNEVPWVRDRLAWVAMGLETVRLFSYRTAYLIGNGEVPNYEASAQKILGSEMIQHVADAATEIMGLHGLLKEGDTRAAIRGENERAYRQGIILRFGGGANEAQRDIIARRGLGLPR